MNPLKNKFVLPSLMKSNHYFMYVHLTMYQKTKSLIMSFFVHHPLVLTIMHLPYKMQLIACGQDAMILVFLYLPVLVECKVNWDLHWFLVMMYYNSN